MRRYPKIGTRVVVTAGPYAGRQARTERTEDGRGRIELWLLGGVHDLGVAVPLADVEPDPERKVRKLPPRPLAPGDRLYSERGLVWPVGRAMTVIRVRGGDVEIDSDYGQRLTLRPQPGFEKRWSHMDGHPIALPEDP